MNKIKLMKIKNSEDGMASFIITIFIMIILALIILSFARITRRDQTQSLDRQLAVQAAYAAESGLNDARKYLIANPGAVINDCSQASTISGLGNVLGDNVSYSCALINPTPSNLDFPTVGRNTSKIFPITSANGTTIDTISIAWQNSSGGANYGGCTSISSIPSTWPSNCDAGMVRVDIVYLRPGGFNRTNVIGSNGAGFNDVATFFLTPKTDPGTYTFTNLNTSGTSSQGALVGVVGGCVVGALPKACSRDIGLTGYSGTQYYMRIRSLYLTSSVTVTAKAGGVAVPLSGAQAVVDVTGKAGDIIKRVQARLSTSPIGTAPEFAIQSKKSLCKRFGVVPSTPAVPTASLLIEPFYNNATYECRLD